MVRAIFLVSVFAAVDPSCRGDEGKRAPDGGEAKTPPIAEREPDAGAATNPCDAAALGLGSAAALELWTPPTGCSPRVNDRQFARSADELAPLLVCEAGVAAGVDFTKKALLGIEYTLSPAGAGLGAFDDGKVITVVTRQREPCAGGPMPMPMQATTWFLLPAGGERTFAEKTCTIPSKCP
jgi:hypothetical protein